MIDLVPPMVISYFVMILPLFIVSAILVWDGKFQNNSSVLTRMLLQLDGRDKEIANQIRQREKYWFYSIYGLIFLHANLLFIFLIVPLNLDKALIDRWLVNILHGFIAVTLVAFLVLIKSSLPSLEIRQWQSILTHYKITPEDYATYLPSTMWDKILGRDWYILARSYFRKHYPQLQPVYDLPLGEYNLFSFTSDDSQVDEAVFTSADIARDLQLAELVEPEKLPKIKAILILIHSTILVIVTILFNRYDIEITGVGILGFDLIFFLTIVGWILFAMGHYEQLKKQYWSITTNIQKILSANGVDYDDSTYKTKIVELIEDKFPYVTVL